MRTDPITYPITLPSVQSSSNSSFPTFEAVFGTIWGLFLVAIANDFRTSVAKLREVQLLDPKEAGTEERVAAARKKAFVDGVSLGGSLAWTVGWLDTIRVISIGFAAPYLNAICYVSTIFTSGIRGSGASEEYRQKAELLQEPAALKNLAVVQKEKEIALAKLITNVASAAWGVLGCLSFIPALAVPTRLMNAVLLVGFCSLVYGISADLEKSSLAES